MKNSDKNKTFVPINTKENTAKAWIVATGPLIYLLSVSSMMNVRNSLSSVIFEEAGATAYYALIMTITNLTGTLFAPLVSRLSDFFGRKRVATIMLIPMIFCIIGVGFAKGALALGIAYALFGIIYSAITGLPNGLFMDAYDKESSSQFISIGNSFQNLAAMLAPLLVGLAADKFGAQSSFMIISLVLLVIAFILTKCLYPDIKINDGTKVKFDYKGIFSMWLMVGPVCLALSLAGNQLSWSSPWIYVLIGISIGFCFVFYHVEQKNEQPIISFSLFKAKGFIVIPLLIFTGTVASQFTTYLTLYGRTTMGLSSTQLGYLGIMSWVAIVLNPFIGMWLSKKAQYRTCLTISSLLIVVAGIMIAFVVKPDTSVWVLCFIRLCTYLINVFSIAPLYSYLGRVLPANKRGMGLGIAGLCYSVGNSIVTAIYAAVLNAFDADIAVAFSPLGVLLFSVAVIRIFIGLKLRNPDDMCADIAAQEK